MITYTTNLSDAYLSLFDEIKEKSKGAIKVDNLEQFFGSIQEIAKLDPKFLRLPLDEPMLEIDANTRKINVDATPFKANGISVQGDHLAETVFFKIDKYFDFMDLMNTDIYINWKIGTEQGRYKCFIKSDSIIPGSIVFGWGISNHITGKSGTLSFAVELEIKSEDELKYNFNTLVANLAIKDGLVLGKDAAMYDMKDNILAILSNSSFDPDGGVAPVEPVEWISGGGNGLVVNLADEFSPIINLEANFDSGVLSSTPITMCALATSGRDASILYSNKLKETQLATYRAVEEGTALKDNVLYFIAENESEGVIAYNPASAAQLAAWGTDSAVPLYVAVIEITVAGVGEYFVHAQGVKYDASGNKIGASVVTPSSVVTVPAAQPPKAVVINDQEHSEIENYTFDDSAKNTIYILGEDAVTIGATAEFEKENDFGLLAFQWFKDNVALSEADSLTYDKELTSAYSTSATGEYFVKAYHYRNNETVSQDSEKKVVSKLASPVALDVPERVIIKNGRNGDVRIGYVLEDTNCAYATPDFKCEIELLSENDEGVVIEDSAQSIAIETVIVGPKEILCKVKSANVLDDGGLYRAKVSHAYNGSIYSVYSNNFVISIS